MAKAPRAMNNNCPADNNADLSNTVEEIMARMTTVESQVKAQSEEIQTLRAKNEEFKTDKAKQEEGNDKLESVLMNSRPNTKSARP